MMMFTLPGAALDWAGKVIIIIIIVIAIAAADDVQVPGAALDCHNLFLIVLRIQRCCEDANDGRDEIDLKMDEEDDDDQALHAMPCHG